MEMAPIEFTNWFNDLTKDLGVREVGRKTDIAHPIISDLQNGIMPSRGTCVKIAIGFDLPTDFVLRKARYRPPITIDEEFIEKIKHTAAGLPPEEQENIIEYALMCRRLAKERGTYNDTSTARRGLIASKD